MNIYIYVDDLMIDGHDVDIKIVLPLTTESMLFESDDENLWITNHNGTKRLDIYVSEGFYGHSFSPKVSDDLHLLYNIYHQGEGEIYLVCNGAFTVITNWII